jgi:hypothetical protein
MDDSHRIESPESPVPIPGHLVFAIEEWLEERIRQASDTFEGEETRVAVTEAVRLYEAFRAGSLTPSEIAELAEGAADRLQPRWPKSLEEAREVARLLTATRGLLALRGRAVAATDKQPAAHMERGERARVHHLSASVLAADPELVDVLRLQTLLVLEDNHEPLEEVCDLAPGELLDVASIFRDGIVALDAIGWLQTEQTKAMDLVLTAGHVAQLRRRRAEVAMTIVDRLVSRERLTEPDEIAEADAVIDADRRAAYGLLRLLRACGRPG